MVVDGPEVADGVPGLREMAMPAAATPATARTMTAINARRRVGEGVGGFGGVSGSAHTDGVHTFGDGVAVGRSGRVGQPVFD